MREDVARILGSRSDPELLMGDILRVLALFRKLWRTEIRSEVTSLRLTLNESPVSDSDVEKAVDALARLNLVALEERYRSDPRRGGVRDFLVSLSLSNEEIIDIYHDERLRAYQQKRYEVFSLR